MPLALTISRPVSKDLRKLLAFGSGIGIEIGPSDLEVVAARVRPSSIHVLGRLVIGNYAGRPAAEWGAEYARFIGSLGLGHLSATVLLPRREVIVRQLALPGVAAKDLANAIRLQLDTLHPYGDDEVAWGWSALESGALLAGVTGRAALHSGSVLVGIARRAVVEHYVEMFTTAGIAVCSFTFSAAAVHAAIRLNGMPEGGFVAAGRTPAGAVEIYGESVARPVFSAEFDVAPERALVLALSELRLPPDTAPRSLEEILPKPAVNPVENDLSRNALPYATALAGACPRLAPAANVLPAEHRRFSSRTALLPTLALAALLLLAGLGFWGYSRLAERQYLRKLNAEIAKLEPQAARAQALERATVDAHARALLLDRFRGQTRADLEALQELTRLIEPPAWTNSIALTRDSVQLSGEAPQAAPLLKLIDSSPLFEASTPDRFGRSNNLAGETFQIHAARKRK